MRERLALLLKEIAKFAGVSHGTIYKVEAVDRGEMIDGLDFKEEKEGSQERWEAPFSL